MTEEYRIAWNSRKMRSRPGCEALKAVPVGEAIMAAANEWLARHAPNAKVIQVPASWVPEEVVGSRYSDVYAVNGPQSLRDRIDAALDKFVS